MSNPLYVFGYGSLMNPKSLALTLPGKRRSSPATLKGYRRVCNVPVNGYAYLNLEEKENSTVVGTLIAIEPYELKALAVRERGYDMVDVSGVVPDAQGLTYAFIAFTDCDETIPVPRSYLNTCLSGVETIERKRYLQEMRIPGGIYEDLENPVYENYVQD